MYFIESVISFKTKENIDIYLKIIRNTNVYLNFECQFIKRIKEVNVYFKIEDSLNVERQV